MYNFNNFFAAMLMIGSLLISVVIGLISLIMLISGNKKTNTIAWLVGAGTCFLVNEALAMILGDDKNSDDYGIVIFLGVVVVPIVVALIFVNLKNKSDAKLTGIKNDKTNAI